MHVENISFHNPYYNVELMTDYRRDKGTYQYDQDQDGRFFIRCSDCNDPDTEADYYIVHFTLACDPLPDGSVYLNGELFNNVLMKRAKWAITSRRSNTKKPYFSNRKLQLPVFVCPDRFLCRSDRSDRR